MFRQFGLAISFSLGASFTGGVVHADCAVIDTIDKLTVIQLRLANDPDTALFISDIRQLRGLTTGLSNRAVVGAVDGNSFTGQGADVARLLQNTKQLLQRASLDDPQSVRPHFRPDTRQNLTTVRSHLTELRCTEDQIAVATAASAAGGSSGNSDAEDLAEVAQTQNALAEEVLRPRSLVILVILAIIGSLAAPIIKRWQLLRRRRHKRHNTTYQTQYRWGGQAN